MKVWRKRENLGSTIIVEYIGMFRCKCGGKYPIVSVSYDVAEIGSDHMRAIVRNRRRMALASLQHFAETSPLCEEH